MKFLNIRFYSFSQETDSETEGSSHILCSQQIHRKGINAIVRVLVTHKHMLTPSPGETKMKKNTQHLERNRKGEKSSGSFSSGIRDFTTCLPIPMQQQDFTVSVVPEVLEVLAQSSRIQDLKRRLVPGKTSHIVLKTSNISPERQLE